jgi:hypothetical protein
MIAKHQEQKTPLYDPPNLPQHIPAEKIASLTNQRRHLNATANNDLNLRSS